MTELKPKIRDGLFTIEEICDNMLDEQRPDFVLEDKLERIEHILDNIRLIERDF